jgi:hypothetical protein
LSSNGTPPDTPIDSQPSDKPATGSPAWWSRVLDGHLALGVGTTYQCDGSKGTRGDPLAEPNWIFEASRRWRLHWKLIDHSGIDLFFGMGAAYKTKTDYLDGSNWNFAEQLGWRFPKQPSGGRVEFAIRHVSNAGLKKPNRGEDFLTLAYVF